MEIVVSVNVLPNYIFHWLLVVSKVQFSSLFRLFSAVNKHPLQEYSKCRAYQTVFKITHRYKTINKKWNSINSLSRWSVTLLKCFRKFGACQKLEPAGRIDDFGNFLNCVTKSPRVLRWSWILNECNLSWKTVNYCIL